MRLLKTAALLGASSLGLLQVMPKLTAPHHMGRTRRTCGYGKSRSKYMPHQGAREIARRLRQAARAA